MICVRSWKSRSSRSPSPLGTLKMVSQDRRAAGHEIGEIELQRVLTVQLPHHAVSDSEKNCPDENVGASAAPFGSCVIRDKTHDRVRNGIKSPRTKIDQTHRWE